MLPWMREFEIRVLLEEMDDEDDDDRWRLLVVVVGFLSYMSLKLREVYLLVFAIHCEGMKMKMKMKRMLVLWFYYYYYYCCGDERDGEGRFFAGVCM
ncbi:hypothetical protein Hanom_Chr16g01504631 [Helianthus anomalus]